MKMVADKKLFWFLKEGSSLDLTEPWVLDMYVQQVLSRGRAKDVKAILKSVDGEQFKQTFLRVKFFLSLEVREFWEDFFDSH
ncbi:MAG: hypothetical protein KKD55_03135 [Candidatus Omnitrophica bacterium]|nr:hypothetical protein [Candidatus Omnitrophota bacterium]